MKTTSFTFCILLLLISSLLLVDGGTLGKRKGLRASKKVIVGPLFSNLVSKVVLAIENFALYHSQAIQPSS